jgi:outer membrane protein assembly factor BamB
VANGPDPARLRQAWRSAQLDGDVYGEPIVVGRNVLVATERDSVYAFDSASGQQMWRVNLGEPIPRSMLPCGNIDPTGVTGTPVVDAATSTVYLVAFVKPGRHDLVALNVNDGSVRWRRAADPPGLDPLVEQQRSALTIANNRVYVAYGGLFGDCGPYKGAVLGFALNGSGSPLSWIVPTDREGGLWAPSGPMLDSTGDLYVSVGNAESTDPNHFDDGNAVVRLSADLNALDTWAPKDWYQLSARDADLGSVGPVPIGDGRLFVSGKNGVGYTLNAARLGGIGGEVANAPICDSGAFGGIATNGSVVVVGCSGGPVGLSVGANGAITKIWHGPDGRTGAPIIAGSSTWLVSNGGHLYALDTNSGSVQSDTDLNGSISGFPTPTVVGGAVYAAAGSRLVAFTSS